jgi:hypothetical protein
LRSTLVTLIFVAVFMTTLPVNASNQPARLTLPSLVGFGLAANPNSVNMQAGVTTSVALTVSSQGLDGPISLGATVSPTQGPNVVISPSSVVVLPGGNSDSNLEIDAMSAQPGTYNVNVSGSTLLAPSQSISVTVTITAASTSPPTNPPSGSSPPSGSTPPSSGPNNQQQPGSVTSSGPKSPMSPTKAITRSIDDPAEALVVGNLLAAIVTLATLASIRRRRTQASLSKWQ